MNDWENQTLTSINKLPYRAYTVPFETKDQAMLGDNALSPFYKLLNGSMRLRKLRKTFSGKISTATNGTTSWSPATGR